MVESDLINVREIYPIKLLSDFLDCSSKIRDFWGFCQGELHPVPFRGNRELLRDILEKYNRFIGAPDEVLSNIDLVLRENVFFVVTGQQPGFLTGPLYTIYKALSAIIYAEKFSRDNLRLIPLFWNASEDHDALEVNNLAVQTKENEVEFVNIDFGDSFGKSLERIALSDVDIQGALEKLLSILPETDFTKEIFEDIVYSEFRKSKRWGEFFSRLMTRLLGQFGLILVEPYVFRPYLKDLFSSLIEDPLRFNKVFIATTNRLEQLGYKPKLHKAPYIVGLFYIDERGFRHRIMLRDDKYVVSNGSIYSREELLDLLHRYPERFSTNAIFRPIAQDTMIPTYIYVGGPSEIVYHAQIKDLYPLFSLTQPNIMFRMGGTLLERHVYKVLEKYNVDLVELRDIDRLIKRLLLEESGNKLEKHFSKIREGFKDLRRELSGVSKELGKRVEYRMRSVEKILRSIEDAYVRFAKQENKIIVSQLMKAKKYLFPNNKPQERVFNIFQYLNKYSLGLIHCMKKVFQSYNPGSHVVMKCWTF